MVRACVRYHYYFHTHRKHLYGICEDTMTVLRNLRSKRNNKKLEEEENVIPQLQSGIFWSLEVIPACNRSFSCGFMNQIAVCSPHGRNGSLRALYNRAVSLSAEKLVFHHVQQKPISLCQKMRTAVEARLSSWSSGGRGKASTQSEARQAGQPHLAAAPAHPCFKSSSAIRDDMF